MLTKIDGDARGGAALSISAVTGLPVKFLGTGEKTDALEPFHPDRLAGRILGMGDVLTLVERAQEHVDQKQAEELARKLQRNAFTLEDFLVQMQQLKKMGPIGGLLELIPGMGGAAKEAQQAVDRGDLKRVEAIIQSMTPPRVRHRQDLLGKTVRLVPEDERGGDAEIDGVEILIAVTVHREDVQAAVARGPKRRPGVRAPHGREMEDGAGRRTHGLRVVGIDRARREHHSVGAGSVGRTEHGAGVPGIAHLVEDHDAPVGW